MRLSEILISTGTPASDPAKMAAAKAKADDIEARLHAGGDFSQLAKSSATAPPPRRAAIWANTSAAHCPRCSKTRPFRSRPARVTEPIRTRQGYIILKVDQHIPGGPRPYKDVEEQVEDDFYMSRMEPAIRAYLTKMREDAFIDIKPGYTDSGASPNETKPVYSAYTPPAPKKKAKVERTRFRETEHTFRQKSPQAAAPAPAPAPAAAAKPAVVKAGLFKKKSKATTSATEKPGKKEKIRYGQKPREALPAAPNGTVENAGALPEQASAADQPVNPLEAAAPTVKTRYSTRAKAPKQPKSGLQPDALAPAAADAAEVADRETQNSPLGLSGDTASKKKKKATTDEGKTRLADKKKEPETRAASAAIHAGSPGARSACARALVSRVRSSFKKCRFVLCQ